MRFAVVKTIYEAALKDPSLYFITGDLGHAHPDKFRENLPEQYFNAGMAEQNIIGVAGGLALSGMKVFVYSIVPFITLRCFEQIKDDVCLHNADVTIIGIGAGYAYGGAGGTHHSIEDIAALRALPNMKIVAPATPFEAKVLTKEIITAGGPAYIRLGRGKEPDMDREYDLELGRAVVVQPGEDITIIVSGTIIFEAIRTAEILEKEGISVEVVNMHTIKPLDCELVRDRAINREALITLEEHNIIGGLGGAVAEIVSGVKGSRAPLWRFGVPDKWAFPYGNQQYLRDQMGFSAEKVAKKIMEDIDKS